MYICLRPIISKVIRVAMTPPPHTHTHLHTRHTLTFPTATTVCLSKLMYSSRVDFLIPKDSASHFLSLVSQIPKGTISILFDEMLKGS